MTTITLPSGREVRVAEMIAPDLSDWLARAILKLQSLSDHVRMPAPGVPEAALQLLRMAEAYEATHPSYAADLRAAACMTGRRG
jgi:hypothetical protein